MGLNFATEYNLTMPSTAANLIRWQFHNKPMQVSTVSKRKKTAFAVNPGFLIHASLLVGFVGLVGYLAAVCHHVH
jgi:hypothetical protein